MTTPLRDGEGTRTTVRLTPEEVAGLPPGRTLPQRLYEALKERDTLLGDRTPDDLTTAYQKQLADFRSAHELLDALVENLVPIVQDVVDRRLVDRSEALHKAMLGLIEGLAEMATGQANSAAQTTLIYRAILEREGLSGNEARHLRDQIAIEEGARVYTKLTQILDAFAVAEGKQQRSQNVRTPGTFDGAYD
ncbi:MAG: hypothetical protein AAGK98_18865 [Pseudomonadota bacterium]